MKNQVHSPSDLPRPLCAREEPSPGRYPAGKGAFLSATWPAGLTINADDWGRDCETTERIFECVLNKTVSAVSSMVFMEDSERAAEIACERGLDAGLHLNLTTSFTAPVCPTLLADHQRRVATYLLRHPFSRVMFHAGLIRSFEYVVKTQIDEFQRIHGREPGRFDGHHHMHLASNVLFGGLLPPGTVVRKNFSFQAGEKRWFNRVYRQRIDRILARRYRVADFFFSLPPLEPRDRLERIFSLAKNNSVEVETHPINPDEFAFLMGDQLLRTANLATCVPFGDAGTGLRQSSSRRLA